MNEIVNDYSWAEDLVHSGLDENKRLAGYYNHNYLISHDGKDYVIRIPIPNSDTMDLRRIPEFEILPYAEQNGLEAPRLLYQSAHNNFFIHSVIRGENFNSIYPGSTAFPDWVACEIARKISQFHSINPTPFSDYCRDLAQSPDTKSFFLAHYRFDMSVYQELRPEMAAVYLRLGIPEQPFDHMDQLVDRISQRPFVLCHSDVHRKNILISEDEKSLAILDWELALVGDPVYDISVHFHKMRYEPHQEEMFIREYVSYSGIPMTPEDIRYQVDAYLQLERVKSAIIDAYRVGSDLLSGNLDDNAQISAAAGYGRKLARARSVWGYPEDELLTDPDYIRECLLSKTA